MSDATPDPDLLADLAGYQAEEAQRWAQLGTDPGQLHPSLLPLSWLLGRWQGEAVMAAPDGGDDLPVTVTVAFDSEGAAALRYASRTTLGDRVIDSEAGWWRVAGGTAVEAVIAHSSGIVEVCVGEAAGGRVELASDLVARTATGADERSYSRLYGSVEGRLLFAVDVAAGEQPLRPQVSGSLERWEDPAPG